MNFLEYQKDIKTKRAVERNIEIIGEAVNRILKVEKTVERKKHHISTTKSKVRKRYTFKLTESRLFES
ncbi:HepT-like ribonuclease domain-containing protein [Cyclobacterium lianum]|uniref:HepT-like ribonuclease domain-containing protein n=1 Tax=Cyclobacterium lianum TaxID=388280 RepID=UPI001FE86C5F|nr:HepT-like ribonuclease domain-containing protein [Cyclobacterium lianum]